MYKLLIADDEPLIRRGIKRLIDLKKYDVENIYEASDGQECLEVFKEKLPDIVLLDINMPKIDGLSLAEELKKIKSDVKIAIITGYNYFEYAQKAIKIGVNDYILKPVSKDDIAEIILKLVSSVKKEKINMVLQSEKVIDTESDIITYKDLIRKIIDEKYSDSEFTLSVLSEKLNISSGYLSSLFKKIFGITFQNYLIQKRMEKAKLLLLTTELKNYEIAEKVGFEDVNYFSLKFKKYFNNSPKQYKENIVGKSR